MIKVSTKAFVSIEVSVSPIVFTCTFVSLATNANVSAIIFLRLCTEVAIVAALWCRTEKMAEGLNGTLSNRLAKKKVEMLGYATL